ncbi:hypothetical protein [Nocardioides bizhenqiangii]|uniref:DUF3352 domain-containing protein n=1 Tax=Nocardioides bizhenqiangii TaxID=3095076 RepID=A0ABZ0ZNY2_9ACTN|nr:MULTISPECIES: hypothetical protein [unclassified Nocardioides]MDZ5619978.1 hypothetical protein [Nocardioides sp. HM23]WQQ26019.1 hypothetical protein SHK19_18875 [Nocardioides sp. HM61]
MSMSRRRLIVLGAVLLLVVVGVVAWVVTSRDDEDGVSRVEAAVAMAPGNTARFGWTDWSGVREELDADLAAGSSTADVERFLGKGFNADLTSTSALVSSAPILQERYGFSPATIDWELFAQSETGAVVLVGLPDSLDLDQLEEALAEIGYEEPTEDGGVWVGGPDLLAPLGTVSQELAYLTIDEDEQVLAASDQAATLETWRDEQRGDDLDDSISDVTTEMENALSASLYTGDYACVALAMTQAADADRTRAAGLISEAGEVSPLRAYAIATLPGGDVRVAMGFESEEQARTNADSRARLAAGPAPGQGGAFPDRFALGEVTADGAVVTMELDPVRASYVQSDLATGPVLFATC